MTCTDQSTPFVGNYPGTALHTICNEVQISEQEVYEALVSLHTDKATGTDGIGPRILKQYANILANKPLHHLFTISLNSCSIPYEWRIYTHDCSCT